MCPQIRSYIRQASGQTKINCPAYHYQYGNERYNGDIEISIVNKQKISFSILSLTNIERGPNIAEVDKDTVTVNGNSFEYTMPDIVPQMDSCSFKMSFYKDFFYVNYTKGYCTGQFGLNATIDGIYVKMK